MKSKTIDKDCIEVSGLGCAEVEFGNEGCILSEMEIHKTVVGDVRLNGRTRRHRHVEVILSPAVADAIAKVRNA